MEKHIPKTTYVTLPHPQISNEIRRTLRNYNLVRQASELYGWNPALRNMMSGLQNHLQETYKELRNENWNKIISETDINHRNPDIFWSNIKRLMGYSREGMKYLLDPNGTELTTAEQVNEFRRVWSKVYEINDAENADFCQQMEEMVNNHLNNTDYHRTYETILMERLQRDDELTRAITPEEVLLKIQHQKTRTAPGHSKTDKEILMKMPRNMLFYITEIFNVSLATGYFPARFKSAIIKLILKSGKIPTNSINYRPISLLETIGKVHEKMVNDRLKSYLERQNKFNQTQHAYRNQRGTVTAIALAYETTVTSQQNREQCNVILRDASKAFDKVWHKDCNTDLQP